MIVVGDNELKRKTYLQLGKDEFMIEDEPGLFQEVQIEMLVVLAIIQVVQQIGHAAEFCYCDLIFLILPRYALS